MISRATIKEAVFWDEQCICLECGETCDYSSTECEECGSDKVINPKLALQVLDNVEEE